MDALEDNDGGCLDSLCDISSLMQGEIISWDFCVFSFKQLLQLLEGKVKVQSIRVVKVVVGSILVLVISNTCSIQSYD